MKPRSSSTALMALLFLSGWSGRVYQVLWREELALLAGRAWEATAMTLAVFMAGLGLGSALGGRFADRLRRPLAAYSGLETGAGFLALAVPVALEALAPAHRALWSAVGGGPAGALLGGALAALVLLPPTVLMGATLPVLARHAAGGVFGRELPMLYGANTLGAAAGALSAAFLLLPAFGRSITLLAAVSITMLVAFLAARLARAAEPLGAAPPAAQGPPAPWGPALLALASGLLALGLELFWTQSLALTLGSPTYAFGLMLAALLLGLGAAALAAGAWVGRGREPWTLVAWAFCGGGLLTAAGTALLGQIPWIAGFATARLGQSFALHSLATFAIALLLIGPPAFLLGLALPALLAAGGRRGREGRSTGRLYAANAAGSVLGPLLAGFVVLPALGSRRALLACGALLALAGLGVALARKRGRLPAAAAAGCALGLAALLPPWDLKAAASGFHLYAARHEREGLAHVLDREQLLWFREGAQGTVAVFDFAGRDGRTLRTYAMNGKFEGSTNPTDMQTQTRIAEVPLALCPREPREVFVLGLGTGVTLASVLRYPVERVDVCEISPAVAAMAGRFFGEVNQRCLDDPRLDLRLDDGRLWLKLSGRRYDAVLSEPSNPWMAGVASLFTLETFQSMRAALRPDGVACQWVQAYLLGEERFRTVLRTWLQVFPCSLALLTSLETTDILLIGRAAPDGPEWRPDGRALAARLAARAAYPAGAEHAPSSPADALQGFLAGPAGLQAWAGTGGLHSDEHPVLQYQAPLDLHRREARLDRWPRLPEILEDSYSLILGLDREEELALLQSRAWLETMLALQGTPLTASELPDSSIEALRARLGRLAERPPGDRSWLPAFLVGKFSCFGPLAGKPGWQGVFAPGYPRAQALAALTRANRLAPDLLDPLLHLAAGLERGTDGRFGGPGASPSEALPVAMRAVEAAPESEEAVLIAARLQRTLGWTQEARALLGSFLQRNPGSQAAGAVLQALEARPWETAPRPQERNP